MIRKLSATVLAGVLTMGLVAPALASQKLSQETQTKIRTHLTEQGYEVRKIKSEDGLYEAYVIKDGKMLEIYLNEQLQIVNTKAND